MLWDADEGKPGAPFPSRGFPGWDVSAPHPPWSGLPLESAERIGTKPGNSREKKTLKRRILNWPWLFPKSSRERKGRAYPAGQDRPGVPPAVPKSRPRSRGSSSWELTVPRSSHPSARAGKGRIQIPQLKAGKSSLKIPPGRNFSLLEGPGSFPPFPHPEGSGIIEFHAELHVDCAGI